MKTCPLCTYENSDGVETCWKCGLGLDNQVYQVAGMAARATAVASRSAARASFAARTQDRPFAPAAPRWVPSAPVPRPLQRAPQPAPAQPQRPMPATPTVPAVPAMPAAPAPEFRPPVAPDPCEMCHAPIPRVSRARRVCLACGWDNDRHERRCTHCAGPVLFHEGGGSGPAGGWGSFSFGGIVLACMARQVGAFAGAQVGLLGMIAIVAGVVALALFRGLVESGYRCAMCEESPRPESLSQGERVRLQSRKLLLGGGLAASTVVSIACLLLR